MKAKRQFTLSQMIQGYLLATNARHLSENTILDYQNTFNKFVPFMGLDVEFDSIKREDIFYFLGVVHFEYDRHGSITCASIYEPSRRGYTHPSAHVRLP